MGAAGIDGYEVTPFLASMFRNEAILQGCFSLLGFLRADDPLVQLAYTLSLSLVVLNYVYNYFAIGIPLDTAYILGALLLLIALPKVPRCW